MQLDDATRERIDSLIESNEILLFMKGDRGAPQCGFSATLVQILDNLVPDYRTCDVLADPAIREGIKVHSSWPTIPQLYVKGEFIGGCDIVQDLFASGELQEKLGVEWGEIATPDISISQEAAEGMKQAKAQQPGAGHELRLSIDARLQATVSLAPRGPSDIEVETQGVVLLLDPLTARRADGARIDVVDTPRGRGFQVHIPGAPQVKLLTVKELKQRLDSGESFEFLDVRTPEERATASIPKTVLLSEDTTKRLESLPKDSMLVFHCHTGPRSQAAAEHFVSLGFTNVYNVLGGIQAWSKEIDPDVPVY